MTTEILCIIVTSSVNFDGNISGEGKHSHANNSCTGQGTERRLITNELTHFNLPWKIKPNNVIRKKAIISYLQYPFFPCCGLFSTTVNGVLHQAFNTLRMSAAVHTPKPA